MGSLPIIGVTLGDPGGIGPEVARRAMDELKGSARFRVFGESDRDFEHRPTREGGDASFHAVQAAIDAALLPVDHPDHIDAVVTAPISKEAWALAGHRYAGHTELLAERLNATRHAMMFVAPRLRVILTTAHVPLAEVALRLTTHRLLDVIELGAEACASLGVERPRVAVCGLNPHAGEAGLLGHEERTIITPAIEEARRAGIDASGPYPADTIFRRALDGRFDLVVAMYHDQGLIPVKTLEWESAVNVTVGLPIVRTSPDHGTAFDIAGTGVADHRSMKAAIELAIIMCRA
jgi:4-hydroxythreonine-4-phosphate dehydrogenase